MPGIRLVSNGFPDESPAPLGLMDLVILAVEGEDHAVLSFVFNLETEPPFAGGSRSLLDLELGRYAEPEVFHGPCRLQCRSGCGFDCLS